MSFPLPFIPKYDWHHSGICFKAPRPNGRWHAGCDLLAPIGTPVIAVRPGWVIITPSKFYKTTSGFQTYQVQVKQQDGRVVRYTELQQLAPNIKAGTFFKEGEVIGTVGETKMLHFECYAGTESGPLSDKKRTGFERRADLLDPTDFLDSLKSELFSGGTPTEEAPSQSDW